MLTGILLWFATLSVFAFWPLVGMLSSFCIVCVEVTDVNWKFLSVWAILLGTLLCCRFQPSPANVLLGCAIYLLVGILYSVWMWFRECRKLRASLEKACAGTSWPASIDVPDLCALAPRRFGRREPFLNKADMLQYYTPSFAAHRSVVSEWISLWLLFLIQDLTVDLVKNIQELLKGIYQGIANNQFQA
jgi:hypothetical protein